MIHVYMNDQEVESWSHSNPSTEFDLARADAQQWADSYGESVELWEYEGYETIDAGSWLGTVQPRPLQLGIIPGTEQVVGDAELDLESIPLAGLFA
jgi:hypothetical protein